MKRDQLIANIIQSLRSHKEYAESLRDSNYNKALENPDFLNADIKRRELVREIAADEFFGNLSEEKKSQYLKVLNNLQIICNKLGFNPYEPEYLCFDCKDTGYIGGNLCTCVKTRLFEDLKKINGIDKMLPYTFSMHNKDLFKDTVQEKTMLKLFDFLTNYCQVFPDVKFNNLILSGGTGTGKTFALSALSNEIIKHGFMTYFITAFDMHNAFLKYHTAPLDEKQVHIDNMLTADLLVIDDLGTEPIFKNVTLEYFYLILSDRMKNRLPVCISTNLSPERLLERYGERIFSRLLDKRNSRIINIDGDDLRFKKI